MSQRGNDRVSFRLRDDEKERLRELEDHYANRSAAIRAAIRHLHDSTEARNA
jgi:Arc/MetJ-type ribon-helix-helix transcriptional regulator